MCVLLIVCDRVVFFLLAKQTSRRSAVPRGVSTATRRAVRFNIIIFTFGKYSDAFTTSLYFFSSGSRSGLCQSAFVVLTPPHARPASAAPPPPVSGAKTAGRRSVRHSSRTHFPFGVNHAEVYNNTEFLFTRFAPRRTLFLRQKTRRSAAPQSFI